MAPYLGFALVTHNQPEQIAFLCRKLASMFDDAPIAIHHDYSQSYLDPAGLPAQVQLVKNWTTTAWGASSVIDAYLAALRLLHTGDAPEWTISLSAADYPVKSAQHILGALRSASANAFLDFREIVKGGTEPGDARSHAKVFQQPEYMAKAVERYLSFSVVHYHLRKLFGRRDRSVYVSADWLTWVFSPFSERFRPYAGDWWHIIDHRAAATLLTETSSSAKLRRFYRNRPSAEESYYQTLLCNRPDLRIENNNHRYTIWSPGAYHPKVLTYSDIPAMVASDAYFARKFPFDPALYAAVDKAVRASSTQP